MTKDYRFARPLHAYVRGVTQSLPHHTSDSRRLKYSPVVTNQRSRNHRVPRALPKLLSERSLISEYPSQQFFPYPALARPSVTIHRTAPSFSSGVALIVDEPRRQSHLRQWRRDGRHLLCCHPGRWSLRVVVPGAELAVSSAVFARQKFHEHRSCAFKDCN